LGPGTRGGPSVETRGESLLRHLVERKATPSIVRATAIDLLANYPTTASLEVQRNALHDSDSLTRLSAVRAVSSNVDRVIVTYLAGALTDSIRDVRVAAAVRLAYLPLDYLNGSQRSAFERAMIEFRKTQELSLDHAGGHLSLGALDRYYGRIGQAVSHFQEAIQLEPYLSGPRAELATLLQSNGSNAAEARRLREEETKLLERDAQLAPENANIQYQLGMMRYLLGDFDAAQVALTAACDRSPQNYDYLMALALLHERRYELTREDAHFNAAVSALKTLNEIRPTDPRAGQILLRILATQRAQQGAASNSPR
jgi:tetratricopeptide (TPR) repeat protein